MANGDLISENSSNLQKCVKSSSSTFQRKQKSSGFGSFFGGWNQAEKLSEIKPLTFTKRNFLEIINLYIEVAVGNFRY